MAVSGGAVSRHDCATANDGNAINATKRMKASERMGPPAQRRITDAACMALLVRDSGTGGSGKMNHVEALKANLGAPATEVGAGIVKGVAKFDEHVQGH